MSSAREFLDRLEKDSLLEDTVIADLRQQLSEASRGVTAESLAKLLVDNGHLTKFQATKLVNEVTSRIEDNKTKRAETSDALRAEAERRRAAQKVAEEEQLLLAPGGADQPPT